MDYDWDDLYKKAEDYIQQIVPDAKVNHGTQSINAGKPVVDASFPAKGHKSQIHELSQRENILYHRGSNINGIRMYNFGIIFSESGKLEEYFE